MMRRYSKTYQKIWRIIDRIPAGCVATYGQIARAAGMPNHARLVGYTLHATPPEISLPWHRVINSRGQISLPVADGRYDLQKALLIAEGITFSGETIDLKQFQWQPQSSHITD